MIELFSKLLKYEEAGYSIDIEYSNTYDKIEIEIFNKNKKSVYENLVYFKHNDLNKEDIVKELIEDIDDEININTCKKCGCISASRDSIYCHMCGLKIK